MTKQEARRLALIAAAESLEIVEPGDAWDGERNGDFYDLAEEDQARFSDALEHIAKKHRRDARRIRAPKDPT